MRIFSYLYKRVIRWSKHRHAPYYLAGVCFAESSFFPIPPDVMLISMGLAKPEKAWRYASLATTSSVLGGILGYILGVFFLHFIHAYLITLGYEHAYLQVQQWFKDWGVWIIFLAGFTPVPYKVFTISAGALRMAFIPFILASIVGRGARFFLVAATLYWGGHHMQRFFYRYADIVGWGTLLLAMLIYLVYRLS